MTTEQKDAPGARRSPGAVWRVLGWCGVAALGLFGAFASYALLVLIGR